MITLEQVKTLINGLKQIIPPFSKPNWYENDESSPHYIRNRPFYKKGGKVAKRIEEEYLPQKLPSQYTPGVEELSRGVTKEFLVNEQEFYPMYQDEVHTIPMYNNQFGEVRNFWQNKSPFDAYSENSFEFPSKDELVVFPYDYHYQEGWNSNPPDCGIYLDCTVYNSTSYTHPHILIGQTRLTRQSKEGNTTYFGAPNVEFEVIDGDTGEKDPFIMSMSGDKLLAISPRGIEVSNLPFSYVGSNISFISQSLRPLRLRHNYPHGLFICRKDPHYTLPELYPFKVDLNLPNPPSTGIIVKSPLWNFGSELMLSDAHRTRGYDFMAAGDKLYLMIDGKYRVKVLEAIFQTSDSDTTAAGSGKPIWVMRFEGTTELYEDDGQRYSVSLSGKFWTSSSGGWYKLSFFEKTLLPCVPVYSGSDEGKTLKIVNGVPTWV